MDMTRWMDAHNHLQDARLREAGVEIAGLWQAGIAGGVVNSTCEEDWEDVAGLVAAHPGCLRAAYGVHPWKAERVTGHWLEGLRERLEADPAASVGEIGLDRWVEQPAIGVQRPVFMEQLKLARELRRPATIHCLKAWGPLFEVFGQCAPPDRFLLHSFNGSLEVAERLLPMGAYFSFSGHFLHPRKAKVAEVFRQLPRERILLETDAPDMAPPGELTEFSLEGGLNHPANLVAVGRALAGLLGIPEEELQALTMANTQACFGG